MKKQDTTSQKSLGKKALRKAQRLKEIRRKRIITISVLATLLLALIGIILIARGCNDKEENNDENTSNVHTYATISFGDSGSVEIKLDEENAPKTVANFKKLAQNGYYTGLTFTEIVDGCIYGGSSDSENDLASIYGEFKHNNTGTFANNLSLTKGVIAMNRGTDPNSAKAQFFITLEDKSKTMDGDYAAFGTITSGMDIIEAFAKNASENESYVFPVITGITFETK